VETAERIVTIGLSPAWDVVCRGRGLDWGRHATLDEQAVRPAGKALNVSSALAWMGVGSVAAGLWGREDYGEMEAAVARLSGSIRVRMTPAEGRTRRNITVVDTLHRREMHLRDASSLASVGSLQRLDADLSGLIQAGDVCVFAGAMPAGELLAPTVDLVQTCRQLGGRVAVDTHGPVLKAVADAALAWVIAPNVEELQELLGTQVEDTPDRLAEAGRTLLDRLDMALISRGEKGALLITQAGAWAGRATGRHEVLSTVGCGDYLLAGFLAGLRETDDPSGALATGIKAATARAWGLADGKTWADMDKEIAVAVEPV
jgi:1-phosphofructokinase